MQAFPLAVCGAATLRTAGCKSPVSQLEPNGSFAVFFSKVRIPSEAAERKHQDCKATYQISWLLTTRDVLVPPRVDGRRSSVRCKKSLHWLLLVVTSLNNC